MAALHSAPLGCLVCLGRRVQSVPPGGHKHRKPQHLAGRRKRTGVVSARVPSLLPAHRAAGLRLSPFDPAAHLPGKQKACGIFPASLVCVGHLLPHCHSLLALPAAQRHSAPVAYEHDLGSHWLRGAGVLPQALSHQETVGCGQPGSRLRHGLWAYGALLLKQGRFRHPVLGGHERWRLLDGRWNLCTVLRRACLFGACLSHLGSTLPRQSFLLRLSVPHAVSKHIPQLGNGCQLAHPVGGHSPSGRPHLPGIPLGVWHSFQNPRGQTLAGSKPDLLAKKAAAHLCNSFFF